MPTEEDYERRLMYLLTENMMLVKLLGLACVKLGGPVELPRSLEAGLPRSWSVSLIRNDEGDVTVSVIEDAEEELALPVMVPDSLVM